MTDLDWTKTEKGSRATTEHGQFDTVRVGGRWHAEFNGNWLSSHATEGAAREAAQAYAIHCASPDKPVPAPEPVKDTGAGWLDASATLFKKADEEPVTIAGIEQNMEAFRLIPRVAALRPEFPVFALQVQDMVVHRLAGIIRTWPAAFEAGDEKLGLKLEYVGLANRFLRGRRGLDGGLIVLESDGFAYTVRWVKLG